MLNSAAKIYVHNFSDNHDVLIGRDLLEQWHASVDFAKGSVTLNNIEYSFINPYQKTQN